MRKNFFVLLILFTFPFTVFADAGFAEMWEKVATDYSNFYSKESLTYLGIGFGVGGIMAHTRADRSIQSRYQNRVRSSGTDDFSDISKKLGEGIYLIPIAFGASLMNNLPESGFTTSVGDWGERTSRAYLVGGPALLASQVMTGASRPNEDRGSKWRPFKDNNGVSGHAFIGAVPFLTAAKSTDNIFLKCVFYGGSTLAGWSRVNDNAHYLSQAALGWFIAYQATSAVNKTNKDTDWVLVPTSMGQGGTGIALARTF